MRGSGGWHWVLMDHHWFPNMSLLCFSLVKAETQSVCVWHLKWKACKRAFQPPDFADTRSSYLLLDLCWTRLRWSDQTQRCSSLQLSTHHRQSQECFYLVQLPHSVCVCHLRAFCHLRVGHLADRFSSPWSARFKGRMSRLEVRMGSGLTDLGRFRLQSEIHPLCLASSPRRLCSCWQLLLASLIRFSLLQ